MSNSIPLYIVTGFLGSGKTTLLKRILNDYADTHRIGMIQNEFAPMNVDGRELQRTGKSFELLEINRGSVFCVCLISDFQRSLRQFTDTYPVDFIVLEASGLADPIAVVELLEDPLIHDRVTLANIWNIVDAATFLQLESVQKRITHQARVADINLINKMDKANESELDNIENRLQQINPLGRVFRCEYCNVPIELRGELKPVVQIVSENEDMPEPLGRPDVTTAVLKSTHPLTKSALDTFLAEHIHKAFRLKGFIKLNDFSAMMVQAVDGELETAKIKDYNGPSQLVAIGPALNAKSFSRRFRELAISG